MIMTINSENMKIEPFSSYKEAVEWIVNLVPQGIKPGLSRMELLMEKLDHPERRLKFIHVAGTNGKGSTCAYLTEALIAFGYDVGTFTSPYIEKFTSRIQYNGRNIIDSTLLELTNRLKPIVDEVALSEFGQPSMFEVCTALALLYFGKTTFPDYVVWETGLGGRLDSTNIVTPVVSVITNIGHDHMEILGDSIEAVAAEKAGIIKQGVPVVCTAELPEAVAVIAEAARSRKSTLYLLDKQFTYETVSTAENRQQFHFTGPFREYHDVAVTMNGAHQMKNAAAALMTLEVLRQYYALLVEDEDLNKAFERTQWPGRLELISREPRILLDGAHNPEGAEVLAAALKDVYAYRKLHIMIGMMPTKYHEGYLRHILPIVDTLIVTEPDFHKKEDAHRLADKAEKVARELNKAVEIVIEPKWQAALELLQRRTEKDDLGVVSGTLYLISDVRSWLVHHTADSEKGW